MPSKPDTFAEVVDYLNRLAEWNHSESPQHRMLLKAARLLAAAGEEAKSWRHWKKCVARYMSHEVMNPGERIERLEKSIAALNALAPELKENDHAG